jgi:hypothetical protein
LIDLADRVDQTVDLALLHVRDEELGRRLRRVIGTAGAVRSHRKNLVEPCEELLANSYELVAVCDQAAEQCLNFVHYGRAGVPPNIPMGGTGRLLTRLFNLVDRLA